MKKKYLQLSALLLSLLVTGCAAANPPSASKTAPATPDTPPTITETTPVIEATDRDDYEIEVEFKAQYIRTNSCAELSYPNLLTIDSREQLVVYYEHNKDVFDLGRKSQVYSDSTPVFWEACDGYDDDFFRDHSLVMVLLEEGSGSIGHRVNQVCWEEGPSLTVSIDTVEPEIGTCDMAQWHILLELPKEYVPSDPSQLWLYLDGQLKWNNLPVTDPAPNVPPALAAPPEGLLHHGDGTAQLLKGGFDWYTPGENGSVTATIADAMHPLQCENLLTPITVHGEYVKLEFAQAPDYITVNSWPDTWLGGDGIPEATPVPVSGLAFDLLPGGNVYEITAKWSENGSRSYGSAAYSIYLICE